MSRSRPLRAPADGLASAVAWLRLRRYLNTAVRTKLVLDLNTEDHIELAFNITMEGLPCRFTSIDFFDETGTKRLNITQDVAKLRVSSYDGHVLGSGDEEEWVKDFDVGEK